MFTRALQRGMTGDDVQQLQIKLAGFRGTVPDGQYGPGTELQVTQFQKDFMKLANPSGVADAAVFDAIIQFAKKYPYDFRQLRCPCGRCPGFGNGLHRGEYQTGMPKLEMYNLYEYPGIHKMTLWAARAIFHYHPTFKFVVTSGYRCEQDNIKNGRTSTNHRGKALDVDVPLVAGEDKRIDMARCEAIRGKMVEMGAFQMGWAAANRKAFETSDIAPTWIHLDCRQYEPAYLGDKFFVRTLADLDV
jgi:hypothetical protein